MLVRFPLHDFMKPFEPEIREFQRKCWENVLKPLCILLAMALELPEDYFLKIHDYSRKSEVRPLPLHSPISPSS